jgi:F-type H+-transporting ATPase subunit alpha
MKKVAGTLKLDQAQFRELEAFAKFGSDLDPATMAVLDKGRKNVELLKQPQYSPMKIEHQVALIYCGTKGLLKDVPVESVKQFEKEYIEMLELRKPKVFEKIKSGKVDDELFEDLEAIAFDVVRSFKI